MIAVVALLMSVFTLSVYANQEVLESDDAEVYSALLAGASALNPKIDISEYKVSPLRLYVIIEDMLKNEPMLFHCDGYYTYYYSLINSSVKSVVFHYTMTASEYGEALDFVNGKLDEIVSYVPDGASDTQKALFLHDYISVNFEYDTSSKYHDIYTMLKYGKGVCMSYTYLYDELLARVGIEAYAVISPVTSINHMWNELCLDGKWYHVDTTWDDPVSDKFGRACHNNFLICDDCLKASHKNCEYTTKNECNSKEYENVEWRNISTSFGIANGEVYAIKGQNIHKIDLSSPATQVVAKVLDRVWVNENREYLGYLSGFGSYNDLLYYNTQTQVMSYNPKTNRSEVVYTVNSSDGLIIGLYLEGNKIHYLVSKTGFEKDGEERIIVLPTTNLSDEPEKPGDANGDGGLDQFDYIYVKRIFFKTLDVDEAEAKRADVNKDGTLDQFDYILIKRAYFGTYTFV